ncbi:MAG: DNA mismatch repair protein MutS, partial [Verrucomicrobiota bacterium]
MASDAELTPMMAQYRRIKSELPRDALLLFRLGDFYELLLTRRGAVPMCGIPFHAANAYIGRLLKAGRKVAVCDQMEDARPGQLVKRAVTQILSPGTHFDERMLRAERNNFLAAVYAPGKTAGLAVADLTTGEFMTTELALDSALPAELERLRPAEIIYPQEAAALRELLGGGHGRSADTNESSRPFGGAAADSRWILSGYDDWVFAPETAQFTVRDHFKVVSLDGFGLKDRSAAVGAAGAILHYLTQHLRRDVANLTRLSFYQRSDFLALDPATLRHLEILEPLHPDAARASSLYGALNRTVTPMGARRLRGWLSQPLATAGPIQRRQEAVQSFLGNPAGLENLRAQLALVRDLERTVGRLSSGTGNARDLIALRLALEQIPGLKSLLEAVERASSGAETPPDNLLRDGATTARKDARPTELLAELRSRLTESPDLVEVISRAIVDEPPLALKEGGLIRDGFDPALDELRAATRGGKDWIAQLQHDEIQRTGIQSLKVRFNSVFGYYIEVTRANLDKVPAHYIRKQTIANGERFITPELKEMEGKILGAEERSVKLEYDLFQRVRESMLARLPELQGTAAALAQLDVLGSFAETARLYSYCRPRLGDEGVLQIRDGRHPVLEQSLSDERFVPNDTGLASLIPGDGSADPDARQPVPAAFPQIALITGPNMAGKSTYIRQVALLTLLAHTGSFLPAAEARIDLVDRIFTR